MARNKIIYGTTVLIDLTADTVTADKMVKGTTAHDKTGEIITGTMPNNGAVTGNISSREQEYSVPQGYHDGSGKVSISATEQEKIIGSNIKAGVSILGVVGTYSGGSVAAQSKTVTPSTSQQVIQPDSGYDYLSSVTVNAIPYAEAANAAGGITVTIGG